jgi:hypothetical protein
VPFYSFDLAVPAATTAASPAVLNARLNKGHITRVQVLFPPGPAGLVSTYCKRADVQIYPTNPAGVFAGDDAIVEWRDDYPLADEPLVLRLFAYSPNARFAHTVTWRFELLPLDQAEAAAEAPTLVRRIAAALLGRT